MTAETNYAVPPGEYVKEWIEENGVTPDELAYRLGVTPMFVDELLAGKINLDDMLMHALAKLTSIPVVSWQRLERQYHEDYERISLEHEQ